ncbi:MAG: ferrochelatase [Hyphomicrobiales bacterium]|nr:ferrochelatase [Hyphomicrobiales bacterium]
MRDLALIGGERPAGHPPVAFGKVGVLLVNLGTPDATDYWSMRRYLKEFLSDRRVIETPRAIWWPVLNLIILTTRPGRKGKDYDTIWNRELNEGPLRTITRSQSDKVAAWVAAGGLGDTQRPVVVDWAMRYGNPSMASRLEALQAQGCERILVVPLYPQYAAATTATVADKAFDALKTMRWQPAVRIAPPWHDDAAYIDALASSIRTQLSSLDFEPETIVASFHGIPQRYFDQGDPYYCHCAKTTRLLREALGLNAERLMMTFQSRFGPAKWLEPYTDATMKALAQKGVRRLAVVTPGFAADCLETIEEIGIENRDIFLEHGGERFARIDCLNDSPEGVRVLQAVVARELQGWI